jgi:hypothetical protein
MVKELDEKKEEMGNYNLSDRISTLALEKV